ncbi:hypothetical protein ACI3L1_13865 [Deinococcus sp. SM5_A1]|uniref:hypothetical protein n=1 Tax=Deinococcus sp. SM5_A1 TaxID=3379094 RepID=UPI0038594F8B
MEQPTQSPRYSLPDIHTRANAALVDLSKGLFEELPVMIDDLLGNVVEVLIKTKTSKSQNVALMTVLRLKQEAHAIRILLGHGYPAQAMSLAANMIEITYELLFMGNDEAKADIWDRHVEPGKKLWNRQNQQYARIDQRMVEGWKAMGMTQEEAKEQADADYFAYGLLCDAKHGNPVINKATGGFIENGVLVVGPQVYQEKPEILQAVYAANMTARMTVLAVRAIIYFHLGGVFSGTLFDESETLNMFRKTQMLTVMAEAEAAETTNSSDQ